MGPAGFQPPRIQILRPLELIKAFHEYVLGKNPNAYQINHEVIKT